VLLVSAATALLAIAVAVSVPLLQLALGRVQHAETLRGARAASDGGAGLRAREVLVVVQVATALVLLNGSGLMMRTYSELRRVEPGFRAPEAVQTFQLTVPVSGPLEGEEGEPHRARLLATLRDILDRLSAVGGVDSVGFASGNDGLPLDGDGRQLSMVPYVDGVRATDGVPRLWEVQNVSPGLLETMQTRIVAGRGITWDDIETQREVMLVSESLARREWGSMEAALGRRVSASPDDPASEIIGVIEDVHHDGLTQPAPHTVVFPPRARDTATFAVRSHRAGQADFQRDLRAAIWSVNPHLAMARPQTLGAMYRRAMSRTSMTLWLLGMTGGLALLLGMVGVYGVVSYTVTRRRREIGIRLALGARRADVSGMFVRHALVVVGVGVLIGLAASAGLTRLIASQLFGINPMDVPTRVAVGLGLLAAASLASGLSAWRGAALEPSEVLRAE
jgi:putative ABC transport system permease protein